MAFLGRHWRENRTPVSAACRAVAEDLQSMMPGAGVGHFPAGGLALDWRVPDSWTVRSARLVAPDGTPLYDFARDNPLGLWAHSRSFQGALSRDDLAAHVSFDDDRPDAWVWNFRGIYRPEWSGWGFSLPARVWHAAPEGSYRVEIDAEIGDREELCWVEATLPGRDPRPILLLAHTCHPGQVADGLGNVALLLDLYARLAQVSDRRHTWRFVLGPETYTAAAVLAGWRGPPPLGGIYCDMLAAASPLCWQGSLSGEGLPDLALLAVLGRGARRGYREIWGNDEKVWSALPWCTPVAVLCRERFAAYHTDDDGPDESEPFLSEAGAVLASVVDAIEADANPRMLVAGPVCRSRHGLYRDELGQPEHNAVEAAQVLADGSRSMLEICRDLGGAPLRLLREHFDAFAAAGLAEFRPPEVAP